MPFRVAFIGAGAVNFGEIDNKTPWDHASRLEALAETYPLVFVGIADPHQDKAREQLTARRAGAAPQLWAQREIYPNAQDMLADCRPDAVWVGIPPIVHGSLKDGRDPELQVLQAGAAVFVEKPISCLPLADVMEYSQALTDLSLSRNLPISVGYVFRYSKPISLIKSMLSKHAQGKVACFNTQYNAAYTAIPHRFWWMQSRSGGPIVEQATHFVDLARYLCGEVLPASITGLAIGAGSAMGQLSSIPASVQEHTVPADDLIPRASIVSWRFESGGLGVAGRWPQIKSSYADAARTYQLTVQLRESLRYE